MKTKFAFLLVRIVLVALLLTGLFLLWASLQSHETLASYLDQLAADGKLESFTISIYQTLKTPFAVVGTGLMLLTGFSLLRWENTRAWIHRFPTQARHFSSMVRKDAQHFANDVKAALVSQGRLATVALSGTIFTALVIRLANLDTPLGHDEAYMYNAFASRSLWHMVSDYHLPNNHVLLSIIIKTVTSLLGNHVWTLRLTTIVVGVLMVPVSYFFAKRFYSKETAVLSAMFVAVFPILVKYSVLARGYTIIGFITLLLFILADYVRIQKNRFVWLLILILSALGFFTIPIMLFPFGALYIWLLVSSIIRDTRSYESILDFLKYWLVSGIGAALITVFLYTPIIIYSYIRFFRNGVITPLSWNIFLITTWTRFQNTWADWTEFVPLWISLLGVFGFLVSLFFHKRFSKQKFSPQLAFLIWIITMLIVRRPDMMPRFWFFLAAPIVIWSAAGIIESLKLIPLKVGRSWNLAQVLVTITFVVAFAQGLFTVPSLPARWRVKDDMEKATMYLKDYIHPGDLVTTSMTHLPAVRYYFNYYGIPRGYIRQSGEFQRAFVIVDDQKGETLYSVAPKLGFDVPAVDMDTAKVLMEFDYLTIYECYPVQ